MKALGNYPHLNKIAGKSPTAFVAFTIICGLLFIASAVLSIAVPEAELWILVFLFGLMVLIFGIVLIANITTTKRSLKRFTPQQLERIESELAYAPNAEHIYITSEALILPNKMIPVKEILWIYKQTVTTRYMGVVPVAKNSSIIIVEKNKKQSACTTKNKTDIVAFLFEGLSKYRKGIFYGYSDQLIQLYRKNFDQMLAMSESRDCEQLGQYQANFEPAQEGGTAQ